MAFDLSSITKGASHLPPRILVYGVQGIGKSKFGAMAPNPIFILTEDGLGLLESDHFPLCTTYAQVMEALTVLATQEHEFETLVVDSLDWMEPLVWKHVCEVNGWNSIEDAGYGKGYVEALSFWSEYIDAINYLRTEKSMTIIQTAHATAKRFNDPTTEPYDRYQIKLQDKASGKMLEHSDIVLFANYRVTTIKEGKAKDKVRAVGAGERIMFTEERPAFVAKNRYSLPAEMPLDWSELAKHIPYFNNKAA
tara:strand:- start:14966 stop:15718 length:753 start_codon:yes stop_codon:yes gene_type:complete